MAQDQMKSLRLHIEAGSCVLVQLLPTTSMLRGLPRAHSSKHGVRSCDMDASKAACIGSA